MTYYTRLQLSRSQHTAAVLCGCTLLHLPLKYSTHKFHGVLNSFPSLEYHSSQTPRSIDLKTHVYISII